MKHTTRASAVNLRDQRTRVAYIKSLIDAARDKHLALEAVLYKPKDYTQQVRAEIAAIRRTMTPDQNDDTPDKKLFPQAHARVRTRLLATSREAHTALQTTLNAAREGIHTALDLVRRPALTTIDLAEGEGAYGAGDALRPLLRKLIQQNAISEARTRATLMTEEERVRVLQETDQTQEPELVWVLDDLVQRDMTRLSSLETLQAMEATEIQKRGAVLTIDQKGALQQQWRRRAEQIAKSFTAIRNARLTDDDRALEQEWTLLGGERGTIARALTQAGQLLAEAEQAERLPEDPRPRPDNVVDLRPIEAA